MADKFVADLSGKGDIVQRDVVFRKLLAVGSSKTSADAYVDIDNAKQKVTQIESTATNGKGQWSVFVRNAATSNVEPTPRVAVTANVTTLSSDVTSVQGALTVSNYASFEEDVDVTTGSVTVGRTLIVDGPTYHGNNVHVTKSNSSTVLSENALTFSDAWRLVYDQDSEALAFEQNTQTAEDPQWVRRFQVAQP